MYSALLNIASANAIAVYFLAFQKNYSLLQKVALHFKNINELENLEMKLSDYDNDKKYNNILLLCFQFQFHFGYISECILSIPVIISKRKALHANSR